MTASTPQIPPAGKRRKPFHLPGVLARRWRLMLGAGGLLAALLAPFFWLAGGSSYRTEGVLLLDPGKEPTLNGREREIIPGNLGDYARTLVSRLTAGDVLLAALEQVPATNWPSFLDSARPPAANVGRLARTLKVKEVPRTYLISTEITGDAPAGLAPLLNAVLDQFVLKLRRELEQQNARRLAYLREERDQIVTRIEAERARLLAQADQVSNKAFLHESYTVHLSKLEQIQRLYWEAEAARAEREGDFQRVLADQRELKQLRLDAYADERVADNFGINRIEQWTYEQLQSLRSTIDGLTTNNSDRTYVEARMEAMNAYLDRYKQQVGETTIRVLTEKRDHDLATEVVKVGNALAAAHATSELLGRQLDQARGEASATSEAIFRASDLTFNVNQLRERLSALNTRIDDCEMESKAPLRISVDRPALPPTRPASNSRPQLALLAALLGFGLVIGSVLGFDLLDDRIRALSDVEAALGGPAPDPVPQRPAGSLETALIEDPDGPPAAALRALAVRLNRARLRHGARLFAFSGLGEGVGNTALALNVAQALARLTPRVLLLSVGRPDLAARAGLALRPAGPALLRQPVDLPAQVTTDPARGIDLLAIASHGDPLPSKIGLEELMRIVRERYDAVLFDLGPVPGDDLALALVHFVDGVVFTVREDETLFRTLRRALDAAAAAGVPALTALLNGTCRPTAGWLGTQIQRALRPVTVLHRRAAAEWARRRSTRARPPGGAAP
jgi:succinoglycan biosynthesis transport protein ExoP